MRRNQLLRLIFHLVNVVTAARSTLTTSKSAVTYPVTVNTEQEDPMEMYPVTVNTEQEDPMEMCYNLNGEMECCDDAPLNQFQADFLEQCGQYCLYSDDCNFFAYNSQTRVCSLLNDPVAPFEDHTSVVGNLSCVRNLQRMVELEANNPIKEWQAMTSGKNKLELFVKNGVTMKCLGVSGKTWKPVEWGPCTNTSLWIVKWKDPIAMFVWIKHKTSGKCINLIPYGSGYTTEESVSLSDCSKGINQKLLITPMAIKEKHGQTIVSVELTSATHHNSIYLCSKCWETLTDLAFDKVEQHEGPCATDTAIKNGAITTETTAPFFLPGSIIDMVCNPGYQTNEKTTDQFTCLNRFIEPPSCKKNDAKGSAWNLFIVLLPFLGDVAFR